jgi:hypothetical protein
MEVKYEDTDIAHARVNIDLSGRIWRYSIFALSVLISIFNESIMSIDACFWTEACRASDAL